MVDEQVSALSIEAFENVITPLFSKFASAAATSAPLDETVFDKISSLLLAIGKRSWADRPRTYTVLRIINRTDAMDYFVFNGFLDIQLPYTERRLPDILRGASRHTFLEKQTVVLTGMDELELERGRHRHLNVDGDTFFTVLSHLGAGKFGRVDRVRSKLSLEEYARKRIARARTFSGDKAGMRMFENELTHLKRLHHHHLVNFIGSYTDPRWIAMLTTPVADCDLHAFLRQTPFGPPEMSMLRRFFGCLCSAVQYLHGEKCRHKDIKPGNILVKKGEVFMTDFGTARDWSDQSRASTSGTVGPYTPRFAAPEVVNCERRNEQSDIWSLGCVYLDMLTRLKGKSVDEMLSFFDTHGSGHRAVAHNPEALQNWLQLLESLGSNDNTPAQWIRLMLHHAPLFRPSAIGILDKILVHEDENIYYGDCCGPSEDDCSTYQGSLLASGDALLMLEPADVSVQHALFTFTKSQYPMHLEQSMTTLSSVSSVGIETEQIAPKVVISPPDDHDATAVSLETAWDSSQRTLPVRTTFLSRAYTAAFYRTLEQDFQNARRLLAAMSNDNVTDPNSPELRQSLGYKGKNFVDTTSIVHWEKEYFSMHVLGCRFDTYAFGRWFCQRVAYHMGTGYQFRTAGTIWLNILLIELKIVIQAELLYESRRVHSSKNYDSEHPCVVPESEMSKVAERNVKCRAAWESFKEELRRCEDWAYERSDSKAKSEDVCSEFSRRALATSLTFAERMLNEGLSTLRTGGVEGIENQYALAWFPFLANMMRYANEPQPQAEVSRSTEATIIRHEPVDVKGRTAKRAEENNAGESERNVQKEKEPLTKLNDERPSDTALTTIEDQECDSLYYCTGCREELEEGRAFEIDKKRWHIHCFYCDFCGTLLDPDAHLLLLSDDSLICNNCTYSCSSCNHKIEDLAILTGDQAFCAGCFRCSKRECQAENLSYIKTSQGIFCGSCHALLMAHRRRKPREWKKSVLALPAPVQSSAPPPTNHEKTLDPLT